MSSNENDSETGKLSKTKPELWPQLLCAVAAGFAAAMQGACITYTSRAQTKWEQETDENLRLSLKDVAWFASLHLACAIVCCPLGGYLSNHYGRRKCLILFAIPILLGWVFIAVAWNIEMLFVGKFLSALGSTGISSSIGVYISETAHPSVRGSLAGFQSFFLSLGMLIVFGGGYFIGWRALAWVSALPGVFLLAFLVFLPESPFWLVSKNKKSDAQNALQFLRGKSYDVTEELNEITHRHQKVFEDSCSHGTLKWCLGRIFSKAFLKPFSCIGFIQMLMQWGGMNILMIFMVNVFRGAKSSIDPELAPVFVGVVRVLSSGCSSLIMRSAPRKVMFMTCMLVVMLGNLSIATYSYMKTNADDGSELAAYLDMLGWLPLVFIISMLSAHAMGVLPVIHLLVSELYPTDIRPLCVGTAHSIAATFGAININTYPYQLELLGFHGTFFLYAGSNFLAVLWACLTFPDNRGLSLVKVEENYEKKQKKGLENTEESLLSRN